MHAPSTRILCALVDVRGEEYDPAEQVAPDLVESLYDPRMAAVRAIGWSVSSPA
jgi:hypothetical protein